MSYLDQAFLVVWIVLIVYILNLIRNRISLKSELEFLQNTK
ncbi:MAG: CcmD family protein [Candidatus Methanoperedens sp.]|nr:CcmD family protein [Candidatus Methanoperedens sp.]